jgi:ABC-2 type transport system permease protein
LVILILGVTSLSSLGIISASIILYFKKGDPLSWLAVTLSGLLSGVYFPVKILPPSLQKISNFIPLTYILRALRVSLLQGGSFSLLKNDIIILITFLLILLPFSLWIFNLALRKTLRVGVQIY